MCTPSSVHKNTLQMVTEMHETSFKINADEN